MSKYNFLDIRIVYLWNGITFKWTQEDEDEFVDEDLLYGLEEISLNLVMLHLKRDSGYQKTMYECWLMKSRKTCNIMVEGIAIITVN